MPDQSPSPPQTVVNVRLDNTNTNQATAVAEAYAGEKPAPSALPADPVPKSIGKAYAALALGWTVAAHRVYLGHPVFFWLCCLYLLPIIVIGTDGGGVLVGVAIHLLLVVIDALTIPDWVRRHNRALWAAARGAAPLLRDSAAAVVGPPPSPRQASTDAPAYLADPAKESLRVRLLRAAHRGDGQLTVTQGVMETGESFAKVQRALRKMVSEGHVDADNTPDSGVLIYLFPELVGRPASPDPGKPAAQDPA